ncbi:bifunctional 4-hydroxy-2-oxoglutarate aldolase/2-dehydro-3-deoxy-phosphogluconate aldolase [Staphylococcus sp. EZ-P03]|uniref:bifunctional 4-hydroxy-2-oxoglutarate aldolase/2-dehydro-3-deoxy-phosphogluconate aldolase n=1 Tax=Staphylococcus sp. EZ-P03 TaxID=2282739 RepID=UPI000DF84C5D|nr:bifunctional 4-hydroxy-2-oxoglutarate aldolase/2-dehydro-3-deoxy-phosphogluconate aldolase [Staphylococcus sp. EZ-P03]
MKSSNILNDIQRNKFVAVMRTDNERDFLVISQILLEHEMNTIEVTMTTPNALEIIKQLSEKDNSLIGAGTVLDSETARLAILNGASFIVSPYFDKETAEISNLYDIPYIPGCMTVTEMLEATKAGCKVLKLFPASQFTAKSIKDFKGPLPNLEMIPTGGIGLANYKEWLDNGSFAVGIGSEITKVFYKEGEKGLVEYINNLNKGE